MFTLSRFLAVLTAVFTLLASHAQAQVTWTSQTSPATDQLRDVWAADASNIWIVGNGGNILKGDGSGTWTAQTSGVTDFLIGLSGTSATNVWAVGGSGRILNWNGTAWATQASGTTFALFSVWASSPTNAWAAGESGVFTRWNGTTWTSGFVGTNITFSGMWGSAANDIWMVGTRASGGAGAIYRYNGTSWAEDTSIGTVAGLNDVWGTDANNVWAVGRSGLIMRWDGSTWSTVTSGTTQILNSVWGTSTSNVYAVGNSGSIFRFDGTSWVAQTSGTTRRLNSVGGSSASPVFAVGGATNVATILSGASASVPTAVPSVASDFPSNITSTTVGMGGSVLDDGGGTVIERGIVWGTSANPTIANNKVTMGSGLGAFSGTVTGLPPGTPIFARAFARNSLGAGYGGEISFTTLSVNANLANLTTTADAFSPSFAANDLNYTASVPNATASITVTPTAAQANATITVNGSTVTSGSPRTINVNVGSNVITILVWAQDGITNKTYTLTVTRAAAPVVIDDSITPTAVITTSFWDNFGLGGHKDKMIDGSGLSGSGIVLTRVHDNNSNVNSWHAGAFAGGIAGGVTGTPPYGAPPPVNTQAVEFDLGANYDLSAAHIWNYNAAGLTGRGVKDVQILVSSATSGAFTALTTTQFTQATGGASLPAQVVPLIGATNVRRVRFSIQTTWSGAPSEYVGLSEVRFQGAPYTPGKTAPVLVAFGPLGDTESLNAPENTSSPVGFIGVIDADSGQTHTWALSGPDAGKFQLTAHPTSAGVFQLFFTTAPDFENPTDVGGNNVYNFTVTATDNGSPALSDSVALSITVTNVNDAPTISAITNQSTNEDTPTAAIAFTVGDQDAGQSLDDLEVHVTATSVGVVLIPETAENIVLGGSGANRTLTLTPAPNANGTATITVTVTDPSDPVNLSTTRTFTLTVNAVNDAPSFTLPVNITRFPGSGAYTQAGVVSAISPGPADESGQTVALSLTGNTDPGLFTVAPTLAADGSLSFTPGSTPGVSTLTVRAQDSGGAATEQTFTIAISVFNMRPAGEVWTERMTDANRNWSAITSSADGSKLAAVVNGGQIYTSTDSGVTWVARESYRNWSSITSSADGSKLAAVVIGGRIYTSTDFGVTWVARMTSGIHQWISITSSADGSKLAAARGGFYIYTSTDSGETWTARMTDALRQWTSITSSADGSKLAAVVIGGQIYTSTDSGVTWTARESNRGWRSITSSADGSRLAAVYSDIVSQYNTIGVCSVSTDSGVTWAVRDGGFTVYQTIASSTDGRKLVVGSAPGSAFDDGGILESDTFTVNPSRITLLRDAEPKIERMIDATRKWTSITSSADGSKLAAVAYNGQIYTSEGSSLPDVAAGRAFTQANFSSAGPTSQVVSYTVTNSNPALFTVQPAIAANGTLTLTAGQAAGTATVSVTANYNGGAATSPPQTFPINLTKPLKMMQQVFFNRFDSPLEQTRTVREDETLVGLFYGSYYDASSDIPLAISGPDAAAFDYDSATGELEFKTTRDFEAAPLDANSDGVYDITLSVGSPTSPLGTSTTRLLITLADVNDMPSFTKGANVSNIPATVAPQIIPGWATGITDGDSLATQSLNFTFTALSGSNRLSVGPAIDPATGNLTFTPSGLSGTARYRVTLTDDASINGGAALTTAEQTFELAFTAVAPGTGTAEFTAWPALAALPPEQQGPNATPANDGVPNLVKFALGIGPLDSANGLIPQEITIPTGSAAAFPTVSFVRKKGLIGVAVNVEIATSLDFSTSTLGAVITAAQDLGNGTERVTVRSTAPFTGRQFFRLRVNAN